MNPWKLTPESIQFLGYEDEADLMAFQSIFDLKNDGLPLPKKLAIESMGVTSPVATPIKPVIEPTIVPRIPTRLPVFPTTVERDARNRQLEEHDELRSTGRPVTDEDKVRIASAQGDTVYSDRDITGGQSWSPVAAAVRLAKTPYALGMEALERTGLVEEKPFAERRDSELARALDPQPIMNRDDTAAANTAYQEQVADFSKQALDWYDGQANPPMSRSAFQTRMRDLTQDYEYVGPMNVLGQHLFDEYLGKPVEYKLPLIKGAANMSPGWFSHQVGGELIETPLGATFRSFVAPETAVYEGLESLGLVEEKPWQQRLKQGEGLPELGTELGTQLEKTPVGQAVNTFMDNPHFVRDASWMAMMTASIFMPGPVELLSGAKSVAGAGLKLAADAPHDLISDIAKAARRGDEVITNLPSKITESVRVKRLASVLGVTPDQLRAVAKEAGVSPLDLRTRVLTRADLLPGIQEGVTVLARVLNSSDLRNAVRTMSNADAAAVSKLGLPIVGETAGTLTTSPILWKKLQTVVKDATRSTQEPAERIIARQVVQSKIDDAIKRGKIAAPEKVIVLPGVAVRAGEEEHFLATIDRDPVVSSMRTAIKQSLNGRVAVSEALASDLDKLGIQVGKDASLSLPEANEALLKASYVAAQYAPEATTLTRLQRQQAGATDSFTKALSTINIERTFTPPLIRPKGFVNLLQKTVQPAWRRLRNATGRDPIEYMLETQLVDRIAGLDNVFTSQYKAAISRGLSPDEAWAETLVKPFTNSPNPDKDFFVYYASSLYGGYDDAISFYVARNGSRAAPTPNEGLTEFWSEVYDATNARRLTQKGHTELLPRDGNLAVFRLIMEYQSASTAIEKVKVLTLFNKLANTDQIKNLSNFSGPLDKLATRLDVGGLRPAFGPSAGAIPFLAAYIDRSALNISKDLVTDLQLMEPIKQTIDSAIKQLVPVMKGDGLMLADDIPDATIENLLRRAYDSYLQSRIHSRAAAISDDIVDEIVQLNNFSPARTSARGLDPALAIDPDAVRKYLTKSNPGKQIYDTLLTEDFRVLTAEDTYTRIQRQRNALARLGVPAGRETPANLLLQTEFIGSPAIEKVFNNHIAIDRTARGFKAFETIPALVRLGPEAQAQLAAVSTVANDFLVELETALGKISKEEAALPEVQQVVIFATDPFHTYINVGKNSLLGGTFLPNLPNLVSNIITGPPIMAVNLVGREGDVGLNIGRDYKNAFSYMVGAPTKVVVEQPTGAIFTLADINNIIDEYGIDTASLQAEMTADGLRDLIKSVERLPSGERGGLRAVLQGDLKAHKARTVAASIADYLGANGLSTWNKLNQEVDLAYRRAALIESLRAGSTVPDAVRVAREALFDYSRLSEREKKYWTKVVWFWRFTRSNMIASVALFIDNPGKFVRLAKAGNRISSLIAGGDEPNTLEYRETNGFANLLTSMDKQRVAAYGVSMPQAEAMATLIDGMSMFYAMTRTDEITQIIRSRDFAQGALNGDAGIQIADAFVSTLTGLKIEEDFLMRSGSDTYIDPGLVMYLKATGLWGTINSSLLIARVKDPPSASSTTYDGYYYKLADDQATKDSWQAMLVLIRSVGLSRTLKDWAPLAAHVLPTGDGTIRSDVSTGQLSIDLAETMGFLKVSPVKSPEEIEIQNARRVAEAMK